MASVCIVSVLAIDVSAMALLDGGFRNPVCHEVFEQQARQEPFPAADAFQSRILRRLFVIRKLTSGQYRLYSRKKNPKTNKRRNLGTFKTRAAAEEHERAVQYYKHHG
jgi:hypothetical protein